MRQIFDIASNATSEPQFKPKKDIESERPEKSSIYFLRRQKTPRVARDWLVSNIPRQRKFFMGQLLHTVFQCHVGTSIQIQKGYRFRSNRVIQHTRFTPHQHAKRRPGLACELHPSTTKVFVRQWLHTVFRCDVGAPVQTQKRHRFTSNRVI